MYFTPVILQLAGFRDKQQILLLSCLPASVNALGTVVGTQPAPSLRLLVAVHCINHSTRPLQYANAHTPHAQYSCWLRQVVLRPEAHHPFTSSVAG